MPLDADKEETSPPSLVLGPKPPSPRTHEPRSSPALFRRVRTVMSVLNGAQQVRSKLLDKLTIKSWNLDKSVDDAQQQQQPLELETGNPGMVTQSPSRRNPGHFGPPGNAAGIKDEGDVKDGYQTPTSKVTMVRKRVSLLQRSVLAFSPRRTPRPASLEETAASTEEGAGGPMTLAAILPPASTPMSPKSPRLSLVQLVNVKAKFLKRATAERPSLPIWPVPRKLSLMDFFRVSSTERDELLRRLLANTGIMGPAGGAARLLAAARTPRRQQVREAYKAKLWRAIRKVGLVRYMRVVASGDGPKKPKDKEQCHLYRLLHMSPARRTEEDIQKLQYYLKDLKFFSTLATEQQLSLARCLALNEYDKGATIFQQGDEAFHFLVVLRGSGSAYVTVNVPFAGGMTHAKEVVALYHEGDAIGDASLLTGQPRQSSLVADERLELLSISKFDFHRVVRQVASEALGNKVTFLRQVPALRLLPTEEVEVLAAAMEVRTVQTGQHIWTQGEAVDGLSFVSVVLHGELGLMKDVSEGCAFRTRRCRLEERAKQLAKQPPPPAAAQQQQQQQHKRRRPSLSSWVGSSVPPTKTKDTPSPAAAVPPGSAAGPTDGLRRRRRLSLTASDHNSTAATIAGFKLRANLRDVLRVTKRQQEERQRQGYHDVCLGVLTRFGMAVSMERKDGCDNVTTESLLHSFRTSRRDCSLVALTVAEVGIINRFTFLRVMRHNTWALGPVLEAVVTTPPEAVLVSMMKRNRWWNNYKRRVVGHSQPWQPSTARTTHSDHGCRAETAGPAGLLHCCEASLPLRKPLDTYPLSQLHVIASLEPALLYENVQLHEHENFLGPPAGATARVSGDKPRGSKRQERHGGRDRVLSNGDVAKDLQDLKGELRSSDTHLMRTCDPMLAPTGDVPLQPASPASQQQRQPEPVGTSPPAEEPEPWLPWTLRRGRLQQQPKDDQPPRTTSKPLRRSYPWDTDDEDMSLGQDDDDDDDVLLRLVEAVSPPLSPVPIVTSRNAFTPPRAQADETIGSKIHHHHPRPPPTSPPGGKKVMAVGGGVAARRPLHPVNVV